MKKYAILLLASQAEGAKALHALMYAQELHEAGHEVKLIFDGAGTTWIKQFEDPQNKFHQFYTAVKNLGIISGACEYCAGAYGVDKEVLQAEVKMLGELNGHPSVNQLVEDDFQLLIL